MDEAWTLISRKGSVALILKLPSGPRARFDAPERRISTWQSKVRTRRVSYEVSLEYQDFSVAWRVQHVKFGDVCLTAHVPTDRGRNPEPLSVSASKATASTDFEQTSLRNGYTLTLRIQHDSFDTFLQTPRSNRFTQTGLRQAIWRRGCSKAVGLEAHALHSSSLYF